MLVSMVFEAVARLVYVEDCLALVGENDGSKLKKFHFVLEIGVHAKSLSVGRVLFALTVYSVVTAAISLEYALAG